MKNRLSKFSQFEISNPKYIFGGDDPVIIDKTKKKVRGNGNGSEEGGN